jgi:hypothetical protein
MSRPPKDPVREARIDDTAIVDCYGPEEQAMGWYYYVADNLSCPFTATCITKRSLSPLKEGATVEVVGMAAPDDCERELFVKITWDDDVLAVPLMQLMPLEADDETQQVIGDWHYWVNQGYEFG